jgi:hypothetical protein
LEDVFGDLKTATGAADTAGVEDMEGAEDMMTTMEGTTGAEAEAVTTETATRR